MGECSDFTEEVVFFKMLPACPLLSSYKYFGCDFAVSQQREDLLRGVVISTDMQLYTESHEKRSVYLSFYLHGILTKKMNQRFSSDLKVSSPYFFF